MSQSNLDIVKGVYAAFSVGDIPAVLGAMSPGIVWNEAENNLPLAEGNPYVGPQAVLEGVFMRLGEEFDGFTVVPLKIYFNERGRAKIELGLGRGKKLHDKREATKQRDWERDRARIMRDRG